MKNLIEHKGAGMEARYYIDGKRVSLETYRECEYDHSRHDCFATTCRQVGTTFRRTNYKTVS